MQQRHQSLIWKDNPVGRQNQPSKKPKNLVNCFTESTKQTVPQQRFGPRRKTKSHNFAHSDIRRSASTERQHTTQISSARAFSNCLALIIIYALSFFPLIPSLLRLVLFRKSTIFLSPRCEWHFHKMHELCAFLSAFPCFVTPSARGLHFPRNCFFHPLSDEQRIVYCG